MASLIVVLLLVAICTVASADIVTQPVDYAQGGTPLKGYLAYNNASATPRPGVLVVHEWWGLNDYARDRARALAQMGTSPSQRTCTATAL